MKNAEAKAMKNAEAAFTMGKYIEGKQQIEQLLATDAPEPSILQSLSAELDGYQEKLAMIGDIQEMTQARNEFTKLIAQVNSVLRFIITGETGEADEETAGCSGSCAQCGGCHTLH